MEFLFYEFISKPLWLWLMFLSIVIALMVFDLGVLNKDDHELGVAESLKLSAFYICIAIAVRRLHLVGLAERHAGHQRRHQPGRSLFPRLHHREGALDRQRLRHLADLRLLRHSAEIPVPRAGLGHHRRDHPARHHDRRRGRADLELRLGDAGLCRLPGLHRHQDAGGARRATWTSRRTRWSS